MRRLGTALAFTILAGCRRELPPPPAPQGAAPSLVTAPKVDENDLEVMLAELVSMRACGMIRGTFTGLRAADRPEVVTGVLWIRECEATNAGSHLSSRVAGNGWLWVDETKSKGGGTFAVHQYVRFSVGATIAGTSNLAYDPGTHVATLWLTPDRAPAVEFKTIGDIAVDSEGLWSSVVGAMGATFTSSPEEAAQGQATAQGTRDLTAQLANGIAVTINLCTGLTRTHLSRPVKGEMGPAHAGESRRVPVEIERGGVMIIGPQIADHGMTLQARTLRGAVRLTLVCAKHAEIVANEYMAGRITSTVPVLGTVDVRGEAKLRIKPTSCPVVVVASPLDNAPAQFAWERPSSEIARSMGGPLIHCPRKP